MEFEKPKPPYYIIAVHILTLKEFRYLNNAIHLGVPVTQLTLPTWTPVPILGE